MGDAVKIAVKTALIAVIMVALWAVFTQVQIPQLDFTQVFASAGTAFAIISYWCPAFPTIWVTTLALLGMIVALWTFRFAMIATRWIMKVNE